MRCAEVLEATVDGELSAPSELRFWNGFCYRDGMTT